MAAIITKGSVVLSIGVNTLKTHPAFVNYGAHCVSIHAELNAILRARYRVDIEDSTMYVARDGGLTSKPCKDCLAYILTAGIHKVVYSTPEGLVKVRL
jgi:deoxycytidylate deaminase